MSQVELPSGAQLAAFEHKGRTLRFAVRNALDVIQGAHAHGRFYEDDTLPHLARFLKPGGTFLDVGANVGNHAIYAALVCEQAELLLVEPNPQALDLLRANLALNGLASRATIFPVGLSDAEWQGEAIAPANNLGAARMVAKAEGPIRLLPGDRLFADRRVDFIKIDVEGHEMAALAGLARTIARARPAMFVEVSTENRLALRGWIDSHGYEVAHVFPQYPGTQNLILRPSPPGPSSGQ